MIIKIFIEQTNIIDQYPHTFTCVSLGQRKEKKLYKGKLQERCICSRVSLGKMYIYLVNEFFFPLILSSDYSIPCFIT